MGQGNYKQGVGYDMLYILGARGWFLSCRGWVVLSFRYGRGGMMVFSRVCALVYEWCWCVNVTSFARRGRAVYLLVCFVTLAAFFR